MLKTLATSLGIVTLMELSVILYGTLFLSLSENRQRIIDLKKFVLSRVPILGAIWAALAFVMFSGPRNIYVKTLFAGAIMMAYIVFTFKDLKDATRIEDEQDKNSSD